MQSSWSLQQLATLSLMLCSVALATPNRDSVFIQSQCNLIDKLGWRDKPFSILYALVAQTFVGKPYRAGTLDSSLTEECHFTSDGFDCVTFVESALALSRSAKRKSCDYSSFLAELEFIRYRQGKCNGYSWRLHYTSDWIADNQAKRVLDDITPQLGGKRIRKTINFMSTHPEFYRQLRDSSALVGQIAAIERRLSRRPLAIIPRSQWSNAFTGIQSGDIIAIATTKEGLDYAHLGIALRTGGKLGFIHASSKSENVVFEPNLEEYLRAFSSASGITVLRPLDPTTAAPKSR